MHYLELTKCFSWQISIFAYSCTYIHICIIWSSHKLHICSSLHRGVHTYIHTYIYALSGAKEFEPSQFPVFAYNDKDAKRARMQSQPQALEGEDAMEGLGLVCLCVCVCMYVCVCLEGKDAVAATGA